MENTKTVEQLQAAVNDLRKVCNRHGVVLLGTCESEGIYGEILIAGATDEQVAWVRPQERLDNRVAQEHPGAGSLGGIGDMQPNVL